MLGGVPGALARRLLKIEDVAKKDGRLEIAKVLETNGYQKFSVDRKMQAQRLCGSLRRQGRETLREFFARENMAVADLT
eukprot:7331981-Alexandrium_andersonii.AAC.1